MTLGWPFGSASLVVAISLIFRCIRIDITTLDFWFQYWLVQFWLVEVYSLAPICALCLFTLYLLIREIIMGVSSYLVPHP